MKFVKFMSIENVHVYITVVEIRVRNWSAIFLKIEHFVGY